MYTLWNNKRVKIYLIIAPTLFSELLEFDGSYVIDRAFDPLLAIDSTSQFSDLSFRVINGVSCPSIVSKNRIQTLTHHSQPLRPCRRPACAYNQLRRAPYTLSCSQAEATRSLPFPSRSTSLAASLAFRSKVFSTILWRLQLTVLQDWFQGKLFLQTPCDSTTVSTLYFSL